MNLLLNKPRAYTSAALGSCLLLGSCFLPADFGSCAPLLAQASNKTDHPPTGWLLTGSSPTNYRTGVDQERKYDGRPSAYLTSAVTNTEGFGTLMQSIDAATYAGKRIRLRASVESQDVSKWAGIWMRVDKQRTVVAFDNMQNRAIQGSHPWSTYDVVLDVPEDATSISFGILLTGAGEVWVNHVTLEAVSKEVEVTSPAPNQRPALIKAPVNLDFRD